MNRKYWVYVHTCPNGKKYVGATSMIPEVRWNKGRGYGKGKFNQDAKLFGWDNIQHEVFEVESEEEMYRKEIELIAKFDTTNPEKGYNIAPGGKHPSVKRTEEQKKRMSEAHRGIHPSQETIQKRIAKNRGQKRTEEFKERISRKALERNKDPEYRLMRSKALKGRKLSKYPYLFPDGTIKYLCSHTATQCYTNKGIQLTKIEEGI